MHIDTDKALAWLDQLREGVENSNNAAEIVVTKAMAAREIYAALKALSCWDDWINEELEKWVSHDVTGEAVERLNEFKAVQAQVKAAFVAANQETET